MNSKDFAKLFAFSTFASKLSNFLSLRICNLMKWSVFTAMMSSMAYFVGEISRSRVVSKVGNYVIGCISVVVANVHSMRSRTNKSKHDKCVNFEALVFSVFVKHNLSTSAQAYAKRQKLSRISTYWDAVFVVNNSWQATHFPSVGNFIKTLVTGYGFPDFFHVVAPSNAPKCRIHGSQWSDWFSGANLAMSFHYNKIRSVS